jgi:methylenetetrahydrofolate--tRNA-(uracil-5-)-methyltransferase
MTQKIYKVAVIGAGLAGSECAYQLAKKGLDVLLVEMRPQKTTPAHHTDLPAELVCSNSFRGSDPKNAVGLLKEEMGKLDSLMMKAASKTHVPAGNALAVDREKFSLEVKKELQNLSNLTQVVGVVTHLEQSKEGITIHCDSDTTYQAQKVVLATGPLTDDTLAAWLKEITGEQYLYFYDAIAPIIEKDSIDMTKAFRGNRYSRLPLSVDRDPLDTDLGQQLTDNELRTTDHEEGDYLNCPMDKAHYEAFIETIKNAELAPIHEFDKNQFFDGCLPIEEMVRRGDETLRYGPMKPVGFSQLYAALDARRKTIDGKLHALVQLRQDNLHDTMYNMVGFQTQMKYGEQEKVFRMIPGLEDAKFVRLGSMHRNTYINSPTLLTHGLELKSFPNLHLAGQMVGCEGYVESAAVGLYVGRYLGQQEPLPVLEHTTALGALIHHILHADAKHYQPMNVNFGLFKPFEERVPKKERKMRQVERAREDFSSWKENIN